MTVIRDTREELECLAAEKGASCLHDMLKEVDPESAEAIHENNVKRVIRALEFYKKTGTKISEHNEAERQKESPYNFAYYVLNMDRERLYQRIDLRVDLMMKNGLLAEVEKLEGDGLHERYGVHAGAWIQRDPGCPGWNDLLR